MHVKISWTSNLALQQLDAVNEVIKYYNNRLRLQVCSVMLDARKAFDHVEYASVFSRLMKKGLCPLLVRFLVNVYTDQVVRVKWSQSTTNSSKISNRVQQGGVLSPVLCTLYMLSPCGILQSPFTGELRH